MNNKKGFISMALVYSFFIIFLFIMFSIIRTYSNKNSFLEAIEQEIDKDINSAASSVSTLKNKLFEDNTAQESKMILENNGHGSGLFYTEDLNIIGDKNKRIYFFRGNVDNNNIVYGKENGTYMCWKIVRTDTDDYARLIYAGKATGSVTSLSCNSTTVTIKNSKYNENNNNIAYVGYVYGNPDGSTNDEKFYGIKNGVESETISSSTIKRELEQWFYDNTDLRNRTKIKNAPFCNNKKEISSGVFGNNKYSLECNEKDKLMLFGTLGKRSYVSLSYQVGLITTPEVQLANDEKINSYLSGPVSWTMSPSEFIDSKAKVSTFNGISINSAEVTSENGIRPVIAIDVNTNVTAGTGHSNNPYILEDDLKS